MREPRFHVVEFGTARADRIAQAADDLWEVRASGLVHTRTEVLDILVRRGKVAGDEDRTVSEPRSVPAPRA